MMRMRRLKRNGEWFREEVKKKEVKKKEVKNKEYPPSLKLWWTKEVKNIMNIQYFKDGLSLAEFSGSMIMTEIQKKKDLLLCAATGESPAATYEFLSARCNEMNTSQVRLVKLDEWGGVPMSNEFTCEQFIQRYIAGPLKIRNENYISFNSEASDPAQEANRVQKILEQQGTIDVCVLGLGMNGHLAFNEPADFLFPFCHVANLSPLSRQHKMAKGMPTPPKYGLTLGMGNILSSKKIILIISGAQKKEVTGRFLRKIVTPQLPATFLWLHPDVTCCITEDLIK